MDICSVILTKIFNLSITASIAILAVLMLRLLLCKAPKRFSYLLWGIVLFRLLCPISFSSPVSLWNLTDLSVKDSGELNYFSSGNSFTEDSSIKTPAATDDPFSHDSMVTEKKQLASADSVIDPHRNASVKSVMEQYKNNNFLSSGNTTFTNTFLFGIPISLCFAIWLLGAICLAGSGIISALRLNSQLKCSMKIRENIYLADDIATPFVYGLLHPKIYLPSNLGEQEQSYIILHEQHHIHRRDHLLKLLAFAALCLHWFNPLVWLAFVLSGKDMEMSCDEAVMRKMNHDIKSEYAQSLLSLAVGRRRIIGSPLSFGENDIKSRIKNVMHYKKPKLIILAVAIIVCMIGTASLITNPTAANLTGNLLQSVKGFQDTMLVNKEDAIKKHEQPLTAEEEKAIKNVIMKTNESDYPDEYDFACCNFINLETVSSEKDGQPMITYYGWEFYEEYKFFEDHMETVGGSHTPTAITFRLTDKGYKLEEYWFPGDGDDFYKDLQMKFPPSISSGIYVDSQNYVDRQVKDCYAQAVAYGDLDTVPIIENLLDEICSETPKESSNPQDYIDAHAWEYRELSYYNNFTIDYCISRFEAGGETGLESHIMARILEELLDTKEKLSVNAEKAANGQKWYDALKTEAPDRLEKYLGTEETPLETKLGIPIFLPENPNLIQNQVLIQSDENYFEMQYYDSIFDGQCTLWVIKDGELDIPQLGDQDWTEETWQGTTRSEQTIYVSVQSNKKWALAQWQYKNYQFAILGEISAQQSEPDIISIPKTALNIIMMLE